jgi:hypothetical protein
MWSFKCCLSGVNALFTLYNENFVCEFRIRWVEISYVYRRVWNWKYDCSWLVFEKLCVLWNAIGDLR